MCYIAAVKKITGGEEYKDLNLSVALKEIISQKMLDNPHGFYVKGGNKNLRTMNMEEAIELLYKVPLENLVVHARQATVGKQNLTNVHGWRRKGWSLVHNGHFNGYAGQGADGAKSDTLLFLEEFIRDMGESRTENDVVEIVKDICDKKQFWGRAMLHDEVNDKMYLFGYFEMYVVDRQYIVFSSCRIDFGQIEQTESLHGFLLSRKIPSGLKVEHKDIDGFGVIDRWSKPDFKYRWLGSLKAKFQDNTIYSSKKGWQRPLYDYGGYLADAPLPNSVEEQRFLASTEAENAKYGEDM